MKLKDRHVRTLEVLSEHSEVSVVELSRITGVSEMTVRRDLDELEHEGLLRRVHGGATRVVSRSYEPAYALRAARNVEAKERIGRRAASLVSEGETLVIDVGSTALALAEALGEIPVTIVTPSLRVANLLADRPTVRLILSGGEVRPGEQSLVGSLAEQAFEDLRCDSAFLGVGGIDLRAGVTEYNLEDAQIKRVTLNTCRRCVVLADASKLGAVAFARVCPLDRIHVLVTDETAEDVLQPFRDRGIEVLIA
jgi:DeoR/GlpR family transcriptional regulator of sugar metabolism